MSLMPRSRLMRRLDQVAQRWPPAAATPEDHAAHHAPPSSSGQRTRPTTAQMTTEPANPSHDFLGLIDGAIGCRAEQHADGVPADVAETR